MDSSKGLRCIFFQGSEIPWRRFGFDSLKSFLKSRPDDFRLQENIYGETLVENAVKEASQHIAKMVASQRDSKYVQAIKLASNYSYSRPNYSKSVTKSPMRNPIYRPKSPNYSFKGKSINKRRSSCYVPYKLKTADTSYFKSEYKSRERNPSPEFYKRDRKRQYEYSSSSRYSADVKRRRSSVYDDDNVKSIDDKPAVGTTEDISDLRKKINKIRRRTTIFSENPGKDFNIHPEKENKPVYRKDDSDVRHENRRSVSPVSRNTDPKVKPISFAIRKRRKTIFVDSPGRDFNNEGFNYKKQIFETPALTRIQEDNHEYSIKKFKPILTAAGNRDIINEDRSNPAVIKEENPRLHVSEKNGLKTNRWDLTPEAMAVYKKQFCDAKNFAKIDWDDPNNFLGLSNQQPIKHEFDFQMELDRYKMAKSGAIEFNYKGNSNLHSKDYENENKFSKRTVNFWYPPIKLKLHDVTSKTPEKPGYPVFTQSTPIEKSSSIREIPSFGNISEIHRLDSERSSTRTASTSYSSRISSSMSTDSYSSEFKSWFDKTKNTYMGWKIMHGKFDPNKAKSHTIPRIKIQPLLLQYAVPKSASVSVNTRPAEIIPEIVTELDKDSSQIKNSTNSYVEYIQELQKKKETPKNQLLPHISFKIPKIKGFQVEKDSSVNELERPGYFSWNLPRSLSICSVASDLSKISINSADLMMPDNPAFVSAKDEKPKIKKGLRKTRSLKLLEKSNSEESVEDEEENVVKKTRKSKKSLNKPNNKKSLEANVKVVKRTRKSKKSEEKSNTEDVMEVDVTAEDENGSKKTTKSEKSLESSNSEDVNLVDVKEEDIKPVFKIEPLKYKVAAREYDQNIISKVISEKSYL